MVTPFLKPMPGGGFVDGKRCGHFPGAPSSFSRPLHNQTSVMRVVMRAVFGIRGIQPPQEHVDASVLETVGFLQHHPLGGRGSILSTMTRTISSNAHRQRKQARRFAHELSAFTWPVHGVNAAQFRFVGYVQEFGLRKDEKGRMGRISFVGMI